jgi:hypothetical protein
MAGIRGVCGAISVNDQAYESANRAATEVILDGRISEKRRHGTEKLPLTRPDPTLGAETPLFAELPAMVGLASAMATLWRHCPFGPL